MFTSLKVTWTWLSIRPGIMVRPPQSTTVGARGLDRLVRRFLDLVALDQQLETALQLADFRLEQLEVLEQKLRHFHPL